MKGWQIDIYPEVKAGQPRRITYFFRTKEAALLFGETVKKGRVYLLHIRSGEIPGRESCDYRRKLR